MTTALDWNHRGLFRQGKPFYPKVALEECFDLVDDNTVVTIRLLARLQEDLDWHKELTYARSLPKEGWILWEIDLGLSELSFPYEDEMQFQSFSLALKHFSKEIYPEFEQRSLGVLLYRGKASFIPPRFWTATRKELFEEYEKDRKDLPKDLLLLNFGADLFIDYLQTLFTSLVDQLPVFLLLEPEKALPLSHLCQLLSKERTEHFLIALKGEQSSVFTPFSWQDKFLMSVPQTDVGVCFPTMEGLSHEILECFERLFGILQRQGISFRVVYESHLNEEWDGVNTLYCFSELVSPLGKRKMRGFIAAGGEIIELERDFNEEELPLPSGNLQE